MVFEAGGWKVTTSLDPMEGRRYMEPTKGKELDNMYNVTVWMYDYVNPIEDGSLS
jgi:hypothetical protein